MTAVVIDMAKGKPALHPERKGQLNKSPKVNWVEARGDLPPYINSVATALVREGKTRKEAIKTAVTMAKKTCATGRIENLPNKPKVSKAIQAAFCEAVRQWESKKAGTAVEASEELFSAYDLAGNLSEQEVRDQKDYDEEMLRRAALHAYSTEQAEMRFSMLFRNPDGSINPKLIKQCVSSLEQQSPKGYGSAPPDNVEIPYIDPLEKVALKRALRVLYKKAYPKGQTPRVLSLSMSDREYFELCGDGWLEEWPDHECLSMVDLSVGGSAQDYVMEGEPILDQIIQTPYDFSEITRVGTKLYKKQILPKGKVVFKGQVLDFNDEVIDGMVETFKNKPIDCVPFTLVDDQNNHTDDPERCRGIVEDLSKGDDGAYAIFSLDERGQELVEANPSMGVSVRYMPEYTNEADGSMHRHTLLHVAATPRPRISGMKPWERVDMSEGDESKGEYTPEEVLNLTEAEWETVVEPNNFKEEKDLSEKETGGVGTPTPPTVDLSEDKVKEMIDLAVEAERTKQKEAHETEIAKIRREAKEAKVEGIVESYVNAGVAPFVANMAAPLLIEFDPEEESKVRVMDFAEGSTDKLEQKELSRYQVMTRILDAIKSGDALIDMSDEQGTSEEANQDSTDDLWKAWKSEVDPNFEVEEKK